MKQSGYTIIELLALIFCLFLIIAWPVNLYRLTQCDFESPYKCEFIHGLGLIAPFHLFTVWFSTDGE